MRPQQLRASEVTSSGFRLAWPPLLTSDSGYYMLELAPSAEPGTVRRQQLPGNATGWAWVNLNPDTDYEVTLVPESNVHLVRPQYLRVHTLPGEPGAGGGAGGAGAVGGRGAGPGGGPAPPRSRARSPLPPQRRPGRSASSSRMSGRGACA